MERCETRLLEKAGRCAEERDQKLQSNSADIGDAQVVRIMYLLRLEKEKEAEKWKNPHIGGIDGISCQHLQVMVTNLLQKRWERQKEKNPVMRHGTVVRPTMYLASLDVKTAFDEAKPKHDRG